MSGRRSSSAWAFIAFPLAIILVFTAIPTLLGVGLSLFEWGGSGAARFIGVENYRGLFVDDVQFWRALRNTLLFTIATVPITVVLAFLFAMALSARWFVGRTVTRTVFFLPAVISIVAVGFLWQWVFDAQAGLLNHALEAVGAAGLVGGELPVWMGESGWSLGAIIFVQIWRTLGFCLVLYLAALTQVPRSLYEAASVDGAGAWHATWHIAWPAVRPMTVFLLVTGAIGALQVFDLVWIMNGGAERRWTDVLNVHLYREFSKNRMGYAAAIGVVVLAITAIVTAAQIRWMKLGAEAAA